MPVLKIIATIEGRAELLTLSGITIGKKPHRKTTSQDNLIGSKPNRKQPHRKATSPTHPNVKVYFTT